MPVSSWSTTASSNATADSASGIIFSEGQAPSSLNDSNRAMMAEIKKWYDETGRVVNSAYSEYTTYSGSITSAIPQDDTIPQVSEGVQILSVTITPQSATNKLRIFANIPVSTASGATAGNTIAAVFVNGATNATAAQMKSLTGQYMEPLTVGCEITAGATTAQTITVRVGPGVSSYPITINGNATRVLGGVQRAYLFVQEIKA